MDSGHFADLDLVRELRLRSWARQNYVRPEHRIDTWHPIVLDEMRLKDAELERQAAAAHAFVPLPPTVHRTFHPAHPGVPAPAALARETADLPVRDIAERSSRNV